MGRGPQAGAGGDATGIDAVSAEGKLYDYAKAESFVRTLEIEEVYLKDYAASRCSLCPPAPVSVFP